MDENATPSPPPEETAPAAWQPLTFGGVAAFARAGLVRLLAVQVLIAGCVALSTVWFLAAAWLPTIEQAIHRLPEQGAIRRGQLQWAGDSPTRLAQGLFLSVVVDLDASAPTDHTADDQLEFGRREIRLHSLLGYWAVPYPGGWLIAFNRAELEPWWGAWQPALLAGLAVAVIVGLLVSWALLALPYAIPVRLLARWTGRDVDRAGCWRVASMAQMPAALLMAAAIVLYSQHQLGLVHLLALWLAHWGVSCIYVVGAALRLPRRPESSRFFINPFSGRANRRNPFLRKGKPGEAEEQK
ncbi:MAG: hypothetical protein HYY24_15885 [Verrucomicrobia bacterium]|nr:hypothetical protein [Verrucomicrobiota bacterium]